MADFLAFFPLQGSWLLSGYWLLTAFFLTIFLLTTLANLVTFPKLRSAKPAPQAASLSVLIPARNEAAVIGETVRRLLAQPELSELLILDDQSEDETTAVARAAAHDDPRLQVISGAPLPAGWLGKNWACWQLSQAATGARLVFTDADVAWEPGSLAALMQQFEETQSDLLTVWPTQTTHTWGERLVVPLMKFAILSYLPIVGVHYLPWSIFAAANGQCLVLRREAYGAVGGHAAVRDDIVEDVGLARRIKQVGLRLRMVDGGGLIGCRMYTGWGEVKAGFGKNILAGHAGSLPFLALSTLWHWGGFILPWLWWLLGGGWWAVSLLGVGWIMRFVGEWWTGERPLRAALHALLMPLSVLLMSRIAWQAVVWHLGSGPEWKGRVAAVEKSQ